MLTVDELFPYFPDASADDLNLKISQATSLVSSYLIANRQFSVKEYIEVKPLNNSGTIMLSYLPILESPLVKVFVRNLYYANWRELETDRFSIDYDLGEVSILSSSFENWTSIWNAPRSTNYRRDRGSGRNTNQIKIVYSSGIDFNDSANALVTEFKNNLINLIRFQSSDSNAGLKFFKLENHYQLEYQSSTDRVAAAKDSNPLVDLLAYFKKFRPRQFNH